MSATCQAGPRHGGESSGEPVEVALDGPGQAVLLAGVRGVLCLAACYVVGLLLLAAVLVAC